MLRRIVYRIFRIASCILGAIGLVSIPSDLKEWKGLFAVISNYLPDWTYGVAMVFVALILFFAPNWWGYVIGKKVDDPKQTRETKGPFEQSRPSEKIFTARKAGEMLKAIMDMTDINATKYAEPHIGKWLRVQNVIRNMSETEHFINVMLGRQLDPILYLRFSKEEWGAKLETMDIGDRLAAEGRITNLENMVLYLDECEIVGLEDKDESLRLSPTRT